MSFGPFSGLYFALYEQLKAAAEARQPRAQPSAQAQAQLPFAWQVATASAAGAAATIATSPLDLDKLRLQLQRGARERAPGAAAAGAGASGAGPPMRHYSGIAHGLSSIVREEGWRALWRGAGTRVAYHAPSTALAMVLFERCKSAAEAVLRA